MQVEKFYSPIIILRLKQSRVNQGLAGLHTEMQ